MALIIKGDMPTGKGCYGCEFQTSRCVQMDACTCYLCDGVIHDYYNERHEDCSILGEIPDEHGDLIDRKELAKRLQDFVNWCKDGRKQGAEFVLDCLLANVPTVVEATK